MSARFAVGSPVHRTWQSAGLVILVAGAVTLPLVFDDYRLTQLGQAVAYAVALLGLNVVSGMSGQISLGHGAMFGLGAYTTAILVGDHGFPVAAAIIAAGLLGLAVGVVVGLPALRLRGLYLAIVTIAVVTAFPLLLVQPFGRDLGSGGASGKPILLSFVKPSWFPLDVTAVGFRFSMLALTAVGIFVVTTRLVRSRVGRALIAVRDFETAAVAAGIRAAGVKVGAFAFSTMLGAVGGGLFMLMVPIVSPDSVGFPLSLLFITAMIIGGEERVSGAVVGGLMMVYLPTFTSDMALKVPSLAALPQPGLLATVLYGVILVVFVLFVPRGLMPLVTGLRERVIRFVPPGLEGPQAGNPPRPREPSETASPAVRRETAST